jgi:hypothetical protein
MFNALPRRPTLSGSESVARIFFPLSGRYFFFQLFLLTLRPAYEIVRFCFTSQRVRALLGDCDGEHLASSLFAI